jgi:stage II sporulation protein R
VGITTYAGAKEWIGANLTRIENAANRALPSGCGYVATAFLRNEQFPQKQYNEHTINAGVYNILVVELGNATGDGWWGVIYPRYSLQENSVGVHF